MSVSDFMKPGYSDKQVVRILTVDPATRRVEATLRDGAMIQIQVTHITTVFRWPQAQEIWVVRRDGGYWVLDSRFENDQDDIGRVEDIPEGATQITGDTTVAGSLEVQGEISQDGLPFARKYVEILGDATHSYFEVVHDLGTLDVCVQIMTNTSPILPVTDPDVVLWGVLDESTVFVQFPTEPRPLPEAYKVIVIG